MQDDQQIQIMPIAICLIILEFIWIYYYYESENLCSLSDNVSPSIILIVQLRIANIWAQSPFSFDKHMYVWCPILDSHLLHTTQM